MSTPDGRPDVPWPWRSRWTAPSGHTDPTVERRDGTHVVEVMALLGDSLLEVRHLTGSPKGQASLFLLLGGGALAAAGGILLGLGVLGLGALALLGGISIGVYWRACLDGRRGATDFTLGDAPGVDLHLTGPSIPEARFPFVQARAEGAVVLITPGMRGEVEVRGQRLVLEEHLTGQHAHRSAEGHGVTRCPVQTEARLRLEVEGCTFLVRAVAPARRLAAGRSSGIEWRAQAFHGCSLLAHVTMVGLALLVPPNGRALSLESFDAEPRFVEVDRPQRLLRMGQGWAADPVSWETRLARIDLGGGRAPGGEGRMGSPGTGDRRRRHAVRGPSNNLDRHLARCLAEESARHAGLLDLLGSRPGSHLASVMGRDSALGNDVTDALGGLLGTGTGEAYGVGGLGLVGTGRGGGGTGEGSVALGSLATVGRGGGSESGYGGIGGRLRGRPGIEVGVVVGGGRGLRTGRPADR